TGASGGRSGASRSDITYSRHRPPGPRSGRRGQSTHHGRLTGGRGPGAVLARRGARFVDGLLAVGAHGGCPSCPYVWMPSNAHALTAGRGQPGFEVPRLAAVLLGAGRVLASTSAGAARRVGAVVDPTPRAHVPH